MAIIGFWSGSNKETGQTLSIASVAVEMALKHNYKILLIDATFDDDTMERCFFTVDKKNDVVKKLNKGKLDISSGIEGLLSAVASNKTTPEIIKNFTRVIFKDRLDILCGLKTKSPEEFTKALIHYNDLVKQANKYYDMVFIDMEKTLRYETTKLLLEVSDIIVYDITNNQKQRDEYLEYLEKYPEILKKEKIIPLLSNSDENTVYNSRNITRCIGEKKEIAYIPYDSSFVRSACEGLVDDYFKRNFLNPYKADKDVTFINSVDNICKNIVKRLEELKYKV